MNATFNSSYIPAVYIGMQRGFRDFPPMELYNLLETVGDHPAGSTVGRRTLEKHGWRIVAKARRIGMRPRGVKQVDSRDAEMMTASAA